MFLANTFPSLYLLTIIVVPFTLVTENKSFVQQLFNLSFVPVRLTKTSSPAFNSVGLALSFILAQVFIFSFWARFRFTTSSCYETSSVPGTVGNLSLTVLEKRRKDEVSPVVQWRVFL